jgi:hypothetical protein
MAMVLLVSVIGRSKPVLSLLMMLRLLGVVVVVVVTGVVVAALLLVLLMLPSTESNWAGHAA